jgi:hypothetical protein
VGELERLLITGVISAAVALLVSWLNRRNSVTQEQFKSDLTHEQERTKGVIRAQIEGGLQEAKAFTERNLEVMRHELKREAFVHEVKFKRLYDKVAEVVEQTFGLLSKTYRSGTQATDLGSTGGSKEQEYFTSFQSDVRELRDFVFANRLFLPAFLYQRVTAFADRLQTTASKFHPTGQQEGQIELLSERFQEAMKALSTEITPTYDTLCNEIQEYIGLEDEDSKRK